MRGAGAGVVVVVLSAASEVRAQLVDPWPEPEPPPSRSDAPPHEPAPPEDADGCSGWVRRHFGSCGISLEAPPPLPAASTPSPLPSQLPVMRLYDPERIDPRQLPVEAAPKPPAYPRRLVDRPLLLPAGRIEAILAFAVGRQTFGDDAAMTYGVLDVLVRGRTGAVEPYGGVELLPLQHGDEDGLVIPVFQRAYAGVQLPLASNTVLGVVGSVGFPARELRTYSPGVFVTHKARSEHGAIVAVAGAAYGHQATTHEEIERISGAASVHFQLQLGAVAAFEFGGRATVTRFIDGYHGHKNSFTALAYGASLLVAVTDNADIAPFVGGESLDETTGWAGGVTFRLR